MNDSLYYTGTSGSGSVYKQNDGSHITYFGKIVYYDKVSKKYYVAKNIDNNGNVITLDPPIDYESF